MSLLELAKRIATAKDPSSDTTTLSTARVSELLLEGFGQGAEHNLFSEKDVFVARFGVARLESATDWGDVYFCRWKAVEQAVRVLTGGPPC